MPLFKILFVILPVFLTIAAGTLATRSRRFTPDHVDGLMIFAQNVGIPCLLFRTMALADLRTSFDIDLLASFYISAGLCFAIGIASAAWLFRLPKPEAIVTGFSVMYANALLLGVPITEIAFGTGAATSNFAIVAFQAPICYLLGVTVMETVNAGGRSLSHTAGVTLLAIVRQPHLVALAAGLSFNLAGFGLPSMLTKAVEMIGTAALPTALFALGGILSRYRLRGSLPVSLAVVGLSLIVNPAITLALGVLVFGLPSMALNSAVLTSAMAPGVNSYMFASMYRQAQDVAASALILGTIASVLSASLWIMVLTNWPLGR